MIDFTSRQLRAFLLVAQHRSFTRAAGVLFITPSGLSVLIRELENQLGVRLFDRTTRQVLLTKSGSQLLNVTHDESVAVVIAEVLRRSRRIDSSVDSGYGLGAKPFHTPGM